MEDISVIITIISTVIGLVVAFIGLMWKFFKHFDDKFDRKIDDIKRDVSENQKANAKCGEKLNSIEKTLERFEGGFDKFNEEFIKEFMKMYEAYASVKKYTGNPISPEEKEMLLKKFKDGTIRKDEAEKLKKILEEEKKEAENKGDVVAGIVIGLLLAGLTYLLYKLMTEEE